jgi:hypothetical protein
MHLTSGKVGKVLWTLSQHMSNCMQQNGAPRDLRACFASLSVDADDVSNPQR